MGVNSQMSVEIIALVGGNPRASSPRGARTGPRVWEGHLPLKLVHLWPWLALFPPPVSLLDLRGAVVPARASSSYPPTPALSTLPLWLSFFLSWIPSRADRVSVGGKQRGCYPPCRLWSLPCSSALRKPLK